MSRNNALIGSCLALAFAASLAPGQTLLLPIAGGAENPDLETVNRLFTAVMEDRYPARLITRGSPCETRSCALEAAGAAGAAEVIHSSLHRLGSRWIFAATVMDSAGRNAFSQRLTAGSIEDMEMVTRRMADALASRQDAEKVATVDNITQREVESEPERRRSLYSSGVSLGYLFPVGNSFGYVNRDEFGPDRHHEYSQMIRLGWLNTWEFRNDLNLGAEVIWSIPYAIGADLNLRYLFNRGDVSPFVGGGLGLHYVKSDEGPGTPANKRNSGPALNAQGGLMLFRTYDVNVMLRGQYQVVFNSDVDHGPAFDVGVSLRPKEGRGAAKQDDGLGFWGYAGITLLTLMVIGAVAN